MPASVQELTNQSGFVFEGAVRRVGAVATVGLQATRDMAVVQVTKILKGPPALARFTGREITVQLHEHETVHEGLRAVFFTTGLHFGEGLAVREVGRHDIEPALERQVDEAMQRASDEQLLQRLTQAEIVVSGVAIDTHPFEPATAAKRRVSEHDPHWWECAIEVDTVEKGKVKPVEKGKTAPREVVTLFASSTDVAWYRAPKFEKGSVGVWLLHRIELRGEPVPGLATAHALDFQPLSQLERIRALLRREQA
jgi:hypothetical protein